MTKAILISFGLMVALHGFCFANEGEGEGKAEGKPKEAARANVEEYSSVLARMKAKRAAVKASEDHIQQLFREKRESADPAKQREIIAEVKAAHKEMEEVYRNYQEELKRIKYEYPAMGDKAPRRYQRLHLKSLQELENASGLSAELDRTHAQMRAVYGRDEDKKQADNALREPASQKEGPSDEMMERPVLKVPGKEAAPHGEE